MNDADSFHFHLTTQQRLTLIVLTGQDDTYGSAGATGGAGTGRDDEYGMGSGRTGTQQSGGYGSGTGTGSGSYGDDDGTQSGGNKQDSTAGKLMQKAGDLFNSDKLKERGAEKRGDAGGYGGNNDY